MNIIKNTVLCSEDFKNSGPIVSTRLAMCPMCGKAGNDDTSVSVDILVQQAPDDPNEKVVTSFIACGYCKKNLGWGFRVTDGETSTEGEKAPDEECVVTGLVDSTYEEK